MNHYCMRPYRSALTLLIVLVALHAQAQDTYFVCDSSTDVVYRMVDSDGNGAIDPATEVNIYFDDTSTGPDLSTPLHLLPYGGGLLLADGGTLDAILLLRDQNDDGDANDSGEVNFFYDDSSPGPDLSIPNGLVMAADGGKCRP